MDKEMFFSTCRTIGMFVGLLIVLTGCCVPKSFLVKQPDYMIKRLFSEMSDAEVSQLIQQKAGSIKVISFYSRVWVEIDREEYAFTEVCTFKAPSLIYCEALGFLDRPQIIFTSDGEIVSSFSIPTNSYYTGKANQQNLFTLRGMLISIEEMMALLSGRPPSLSSVGYEWGFYIPPNHTYFLERYDPQENIGQRIWIDINSDQILCIQKYELSTGNLIYTATFPGHSHSSIPGYAEIELYREGFQMRMGLSPIKMNTPLQDSVTFRYRPKGEDVTIYQLDDQQLSVSPLAPYRETYQKK